MKLNKVFSPAITLLNKFKYPQKFIIISSVFIILIGWLLFNLITSLNADINFAHKEKIGIQYIGSLKKLLQDFQQHRGMESAYLNGDKSFEAKINKKELEIIDDIKNITYLNQKYGIILKIENKWSRIESNKD